MGGNAFKDVGAIHQTEVHDTLASVYTKINLKYPHNVLGSTGKREFNGDLDIGVEIPKSKRREFFLQLKEHFGDHDTRSYGSVCSVKCPIVNMGQHNTHFKRTGLVQIDFIMGDDLEWLKFFYHSPTDTQLKGTHRNIAISTLAGFTDRVEGIALTETSRPINVARHKWSPTTKLTRVTRSLKWNSDTGTWCKKPTEVILEHLDSTPDAVAHKLFKGKCGAEYLDSCEKVIEAINIVYKEDPEYKERIFKQMAWDLQNNHNIGKTGWDYPEEIVQYL